MFGTVEQLESAVDQIASMVRGAETEELSRPDALEALERIERSATRLSSTIGAFATDLEARRAHEPDAARSMADWLSARTGERRATTGSRLHLARKLRSMPATSEALDAAQITGSHAQVLSRALNSRTVDAFARDEELLVGLARKLTADQLVQAIEFWLRRNDLDGPEPDPEDRDRFFLSQTLDGRLKGNFDLGGDLSLAVKSAIDEIYGQLLRRDKENREADPTDPGLDDTPSKRRARALGELCSRAAASPKNPSRRQPLIVLHTTVNTLAGTGDPEDWLMAVEQAWRSAIPSAQANLWACDCWIAEVVIRKEDGEVLDAGRELRIANRAMRRALVARDGHHCAVPGCSQPVGYCDAHHIVWWIKGGHTKLDNLVFLCRWHHLRIHAGDLTVEMVDGRPRFTNRAGQVLVEPRGGPPPGDPPQVEAA